MTQYDLDENDFRLIAAGSDIDTIEPKIDGVLRNLDATDSIIITTESAGGSDIATILGDATTPSNHKLVLGPGDEVTIRNQRKLFIKASANAPLLQWIPFRFV